MLINEFNEIIDRIENVVNDAPQELQKQFGTIKKEGNQAIEKGDTSLLNNIIEQTKELIAHILLSNDNVWIGLFLDLQNDSSITGNPAAQRHINMGLEALNNGDMDTLKACVQSLFRLMPSDKVEKLNAKMAGITK